MAEENGTDGLLGAAGHWLVPNWSAPTEVRAWAAELAARHRSTSQEALRNPLPAAHDCKEHGLFLVDALVRDIHDRAKVLPETTTGGKRIIIRLPLTPVAA